MHIGLSVIIANYNYGRFLEDAIRSILSQGMGDRVEIIICDAASTDNSVEIIKKYAGNLPPNTERNSAVHLSSASTPVSWWCSEKDGGQSAAFNKGFAHARGEWLTWLNADEMYMPGTFFAFFRFLRKHKNAEWISGNKLSFDCETHVIRQVFWGPHCQPPILRKTHAFNAVFGPSTFFKKSLYEKAGPFDEKLHYAMDSEYWARLTMLGCRPLRLHHICWAFGVHEGSKTAGFQSDETTLRRRKETEYWHKKLGYDFKVSFSNVWYDLWVIWRILDGSWIKRMYLKRKLEGRMLEMKNDEFTGKPRIAIINEKLMDYRIPIYDLLTEKYDLTLVYSYPFSGDYKGKFKHIKLREPRKIGPFYIHRDNVFKLCKKFDAVLMLGEIRRLKLILPVFLPRKFKIAFWTIGVATSKGFDADTRMDCIRDYIYKRADACLFYSDYARDRAIRKGYDPRAVFVDDNTVRVLPRKGDGQKDSFLFIGSLYKAKGIFVLLEAYKMAVARCGDVPALNIIGKGEEFEGIKKWIDDNELQDRIKLVGAVYDKEIKRDYFERAHICISPRQAGLAVLEAMGYGVPFVTMHNAITGGERLNIKNGENGVLLQNEGDLSDVLVDVVKHPQKYHTMGEAAYKHYWTNRTPEHMAEGIENVIDYLLESKKGS